MPKIKTKKKKNNNNFFKYKTQYDKKISIHNNVLINNGIATAFFIMIPYNYQTSDPFSIEDHKSALYNTMKILYDSMKEMKISIFNVSNIVTKSEVIKNITETIRKYNPSYDRMPEIYKDLISNTLEDYTILGVDIDISKNVDVESQSVREVLNNTINGFFEENFSSSTQNVNVKVLDNKIQNVSNKLQGRAIPVDEKMVLNIYMNMLFPEYDIVYNNFVTSHQSAILGTVKQDIYPHVGWAELTNTGIATVGFNPEPTFISILDVVSFPEEIETQNFSLEIPGLKVNIRARDKSKVELDFRKMRASVKEEYKDAAAIGDEDNVSGESWDAINGGITDVRKGRILADVDAKILVMGSTKEEMEQKRAHYVSVLADMNVVVTISPKQAESFINSFIKGRPDKYMHLMDLEYALSMNQDQGVSVGDSDSEFKAMKIGDTY